MTSELYPVVILAGGLAKRLGPLTADTPKALVDVNGEPFVFYQLRWLAGQGIRRVVLCIGHLGEQIIERLGDGRAFNLQVEYVFDGPTLLGTAGAVRRAREQIGPRFFVLYGDSYLECEYGLIQRAFECAGQRALMTVYRNEGQFDASNVEFADGRILAYDKRTRTPHMRHIDYGLGVFDARAFDHVPADRPHDLAQLYADLLAADQLAAYELPTRFYEIGSQRGLAETRALLAQRAAERAFTRAYIDETNRVVAGLDQGAIERMVGLIADARAAGGRLFILGVGGSAANASHAVNDFRKIVGIEAYTPTDNVSELTARVNDDGWASVLVEWLRGSRLRRNDLILVFSVGGGNREQNVSPNLVAALEYARECGAPIIGVVGRDGGYTAQVASACVRIPVVNPAHTTPHTEAFQAVVWHLLVSHPRLKTAQTKWESVR